MAPVLLPTPLAINTLNLGQIVSDPLDPSSSSYLSPTKPSSTAPRIQRDYKDIISHDASGHFVSSLGNRVLNPRDSLLLVQADSMEYQALDKPSRAFTTLQKDADAKNYLLQMAKRDRPLYYVTGLQKLRNPTFKRGVVREGSLAEVSKDEDPQVRIALHTRRDSAMDVKASDHDENDAVSGVEIRKVKCHVGSPLEPHLLDDIDYDWEYYKLDPEGDEQLSIGLGKPLTAAEIHGLAGMDMDGLQEEDEFTDESHDGGSDGESDAEEGIAGFRVKRGMW